MAFFVYYLNNRKLNFPYVNLALNVACNSNIYYKCLFTCSRLYDKKWVHDVLFHKILIKKKVSIYKNTIHEYP